jgi:hypothetical protein
MRLLVVLLFLLTPLRGVTAAALCYVADHGSAAACEPGMTGMVHEAGGTTAPGGPSGVTHLDLGSMAADHAGLPGCGAIGLCGAVSPGIAATLAALPPDRDRDSGPAAMSPPLGPGTRPAPPIHPPRA